MNPWSAIILLDCALWPLTFISLRWCFLVPFKEHKSNLSKYFSFISLIVDSFTYYSIILFLFSSFSKYIPYFGFFNIFFCLLTFDKIYVEIDLIFVKEENMGLFLHYHHYSSGRLEHPVLQATAWDRWIQSLTSLVPLYRTSLLDLGAIASVRSAIQIS